jgi:hypothetical protein
MENRSLRRRAALIVTSAALVAATAFSGSALASTQSDTPSTPVPISTPDGLLMSYVVNVRAANHGQMKLAERAVRDAGGTVVQSWSQIGVIVAHSSRAAFRNDVVHLGKGHTVESVGATRTVAVSEGTPSLGGPPRKGASPGTAKKHASLADELQDATRHSTLARPSSGTWHRSGPTRRTRARTDPDVFSSASLTAASSRATPTLRRTSTLRTRSAAWTPVIST